MSCPGKHGSCSCGKGQNSRRLPDAFAPTKDPIARRTAKYSNKFQLINLPAAPPIKAASEA